MNSQGCGVENNTYAQRVQMQKVLFTNGVIMRWGPIPTLQVNLVPSFSLVPGP